MNTMLAYFNGEIIPLDEVKISPFDRGFQFGDGVYEVIRYYPPKLFQIGFHLDRLKGSLEKMKIKVDSLEFLEPTIMELLTKNNLLEVPSIAYLQITRGVQFPRRHDYADELIPTVLIYTDKLPVKNNILREGIKVGLEEDVRWLCCDIKSISLAANAAAKQRAKENGFDETIFHRNGMITEGTHSNVCFVKNGKVVTPPLSNLVLPGVTRRTVLQLCIKLGIEVDERGILLNELNSFDEVFMTATTAGVLPVIEIEGTKINSGKPGNLTCTLQDAYQKLITG